MPYYRLYQIKRGHVAGVDNFEARDDVEACRQWRRSTGRPRLSSGQTTGRLRRSRPLRMRKFRSRRHPAASLQSLTNIVQPLTGVLTVMHGAMPTPTQVSNPAKSEGWRRHRRIDVLFGAELRTEKGAEVARVVELSPRGARLHLSASVILGEVISLRRSGLELEGRVAWIAGGATGVEFVEPLSEAKFLSFRKARRHAR